MGSITLDCLHEIGNQIITAFQLRVDIAPGIPDQIVQVDEPVVNGDHIDNRQQNQDGYHNKNRSHAVVPCFRYRGMRTTKPTASWRNMRISSGLKLPTVLL